MITWIILLLNLIADFLFPGQEIIQEQITRVLLERLIVNRPHPWGLLITFIELIKVIIFFSIALYALQLCFFLVANYMPCNLNLPNYF